MRINCPYCGDRDAQEFVYRGDAAPVRPPTLEGSGDEGVFDYVYLRDNPAGPMREHWYHANGCRNWLVAARDTLSHEISAVALARDGVP